MRIATLMISGLALANFFATPAFADEVSDRVVAALAHPDRSEDERYRDQFRLPVEVISFVGIQSGMSLIDVAAGGGWYTEVLAAAVGPDGRVVAQNPIRSAERSAPALALKQARSSSAFMYSCKTGKLGSRLICVKRASETISL